MNSEQAHQIGLCKSNAEFIKKLAEYNRNIVSIDRLSKKHSKVTFEGEDNSLHVRNELLRPGGQLCS